MKPPAGPGAAFDLVAEGIWSRLRDVLMAQSRWDRFVQDPEGGGSSEAMATPAPGPEEARRLAEELALRAFRVGVDPVNHRILERLAREGSAGLQALTELTGLPQVALMERVSDLVQVGLAAREMDSREVLATPLTEGLVAVVEEVRARLARVLAERWAEATRPEGRAGR